MISTTTALRDPLGLHARPGVKLVQLAKRFRSNIEVTVAPEGPWTNAKCLIPLLKLKARQGDLLRFRAEGDDADAALAAITALVDAGFAEEGVHG